MTPTMLVTKRHACFLAVNAALIFVNLQLWTYYPRITTPPDVENELPGDAYDNYDSDHVVKSREEYNMEALAPKKVRSAAIWNTKRHGNNSNTLLAKLWKLQHHNYTLERPETDAYVTAANNFSLDTSVPFSAYRRKYVVPNIDQTNLVNCAKIIANDGAELQKAKSVLMTRPKVPIYEETYLDWFKDCSTYRRMRGYVEIPLTKEEEDFPLAFSIAMFTDMELLERLLRAIYRPNNFYCIHVDTKSSLLIHQTVREMASCFDNVWVASHLDKIKWGDISVLLPELNCMRDLLKYHRKRKWKYFINLTGQEFPLRTNYEIVRIAKIFNGSNDIGGSIARMEADRVKYRWTHRWSKTYQQTIFYNTFQPKDPPPYNLTFYKGELHGMFSRRMVEYLVESPIAQKYLEWCWDTGHPSEHYWNTLNYNRHVAAPGGYQGPIDDADEYSDHPLIRAKNWLGLYNNRTCHGKVVRGICVYGVLDVPWLASRPELFANKFHLTYEYLGLDCLEELHRNRTKLKDNVPFEERSIRDLPIVKYSRKDGLVQR